LFVFDDIKVLLFMYIEYFESRQWILPKLLKAILALLYSVMLRCLVILLYKSTFTYLLIHIYNF